MFKYFSVKFDLKKEVFCIMQLLQLKSKIDSLKYMHTKFVSSEIDSQARNNVFFSLLIDNFLFKFLEKLSFTG